MKKVDCKKEIKEFYKLFMTDAAYKKQAYEQKKKQMAELILNKECKFSDFKKAELECGIMILDCTLCNCIANTLFFMKYPDKKNDEFWFQSEEYRRFVSQLD